MQIQRASQTLGATPVHPSASPAPAAQVPVDQVTKAGPPLPETELHKAVRATLKGALQGAAFLGVPAALGAGASASTNPFLQGLGGGVAETYAMAHGGYLGWEAVPGKHAGGFPLAFIMVPMGAVLGMVAGMGTGLIGSVGGVPGAIGCTVAGAALGGYIGYNERNSDGVF